MTNPAPTRVHPARQAPQAVVVTAIALVLGALTAYGQAWLPEQAASVANSAGSWSLVAFLLALTAVDSRGAVLFGAVSLLALLAGYVVAAGVRGHPSSSSMILFWAVAAVVAGPLLGLAASWVRFGHPVRAALGVAAMSGVLVGEGVYGVTTIADTTHPPYWWTQIAAGLVLLVVVAQRRLRDLRSIAVALVTTVVVAAAFVVVYRQNLIALL